MPVPKGARLNPVYAPLSKPEAEKRAAAGPGPSKEQQSLPLPAGGVLAASVLSKDQRAQLDRHGAHAVLAGGGQNPVTNFLDAVKRGLDPHAPSEYKRLTDALDAAAKRPRTKFDLNALAGEVGVRAHVLGNDGRWQSYGPVSGRPVHVVDADVRGVPRFLGTKQVVELGRTGVVYPGPTKSTKDNADHVEHRGEFEVETIAGKHYVRVYTAVYDTALPGSDRKDVYQDASGKVTPSTGKANVAWVSGGRPLRAVQWVTKYHNDQVQKGETGMTPLLRSYLVPLDKYVLASENARPEAVSGKDGTLNVDQSGDVNQFGMRGPDLDTLRQHALEGSLVTYMPPESTGHARQDLSGRLEPISDLYERLGIRSDFTSTALGHDNDPWFHWVRDQDGSLRFDGFRNDPEQLRGLAERLREAYVLWTEPEVAARQRTSPFFGPDEAIPGEVTGKKGKAPVPTAEKAQASLNTFVNSYGPPAANLNQVSDAIREEIGDATKDAVANVPPTVDRSRVFGELGESLKKFTASSSFTRPAEMMLRRMNGPDGPRVPAGTVTLPELAGTILNGTSHHSSFRDTVINPMADALADHVIADGRFAVLDSSTFARELRDTVRNRIAAHLDHHFTELATNQDRGDVLETHANRRGDGQGWLSGQRLTKFLDDVVAGVRRDPEVHAAVANAPLTVDPTAVREIVQGPVIDGVRRDTIDKALSSDLVEATPAEQRRLFNEKIAGEFEKSVRDRITGDKSLALVDPQYRQKLAEYVSRTAAPEVRDTLATIPLRQVSHAEVDTFMRTRVPEFATMAQIGATIATDALRNKVDFDTRAATPGRSPTSSAGGASSTPRATRRRATRPCSATTGRSATASAR